MANKLLTIEEFRESLRRILADTKPMSKAFAKRVKKGSIIKVRKPLSLDGPQGPRNRFS